VATSFGWSFIPDGYDPPVIEKMIDTLLVTLRTTIQPRLSSKSSKSSCTV